MDPDNPDSVTPPVIGDDESKKELPVNFDYQEFFDKNKKTNDDYVFWIKFKNGTVDLPVVASKDNEEYLTTSFEGKESSQGCVFMDQNCTTYSQNVVLYGHYVYYDDKAMFTPLANLLTEDNYQDYKYFDLIYADHTRHFVVCHVCYYRLYDENMPYYKPEYGKGYTDYLDYLNEKELYDTGLTVSTDDKICTLQTCVRDHDEKRQIIIAKEIFY